MTLAVQYSGAAAPAIAAVQAIFRREAGRLPFTDIRTVDDNLQDSLRSEKLLTGLLSGFAAFALLISATGIAGLLSYMVTQQRREIGIRLALGAAPSRIGSSIQFRAALLTAGGALLGGALAYSLRKLIDSFLFQTRPTEPGIWLGVACILLATALAAAALPAWRAAHLDPMEALRVE
jgi:ABC-type antimicrobial peptide transport system permease subunit